ncbi:coproporphyrinogen III oxidase [Salmonella enterica]|nr:coproporphyrinogen III oxidase [Salmonella enterica]
MLQLKCYSQHAFRSVTNGAKVIHIRRLKLDPGVNLLS